jgi:rsbT co-antagonist protein RsbR
MTNAGSKSMARVLEDHRTAVLERWIAGVTASTRGRLTEREVERDLRPLYDAIARLVDEEGSDDGRAAGEDEAKSILAEISRDRARQGFTPSETAVSVFSLKDAVLAEVGGADGAGIAFLDFSRAIDGLALYTFETYVAAREATIVDQAEQLLELSTPVVKLWEGVVAVPLVGTLDSARTQVVMEKLLQTLVDTGSEHAIIDITGVAAVDTQVAQHLLKTVVAARLMGAECIISGIRPQIAQTIVALGIEFGDIPTKATLADALVAALRQSGTEVVRRPSRR